MVYYLKVFIYTYHKMEEIKELRKRRKWKRSITDFRRAQLNPEVASIAIGSNIKSKRS